MISDSIDVDASGNISLPVAPTRQLPLKNQFKSSRSGSAYLRRNPATGNALLYSMASAEMVTNPATP
jgi:hypothetical protein